jgi:DNA-binding CsgD family transcriptional regulator
MNNLLILAWIAAYSVCVITVITGYFLYLKNKEKTVFAFLLILLNTLSVTVFIMLNHIFNFFNEYFLLILFNILSLYYITINNFILVLEKIKFSLFKLCITVLFSVLLIDIVSLFLLKFIIEFLYYFFGLPLVFSNIYIYCFKAVKKKEYKIHLVKFWRNIGSSSVFSGIIAVIFGVIYFILVFLNDADNYTVSYIFSAFTIFYNMPGLIHFLSELMKIQKTAFSKVDLQKGMEKLGLSPREMEVAIKIINGMKYKDIAENLFISLTTVKKHAYNIFRKADVKNSRRLIQKIIKY